jgi:hypothetical protein
VRMCMCAMRHDVCMCRVYTMYTHAAARPCARALERVRSGHG